MKSLSVKVTLGYVIPSRVLQKWSKECQPIAPHLFFRLISCYCLLNGSNKLTGETNLFVKAQWIQSLCGAVPFSQCVIVAWQLFNNTGWQFSPHPYEKNEKICAASSLKDFLSKSVKIFHHIFDTAQNQGYTLLRMLHLALVCKNTMFELSLCQISALSMHFYSQF